MREIELAHVVQMVRLEAHIADMLDRLREAQIELCLCRVCMALLADREIADDAPGSLLRTGAAPIDVYLDSEAATDLP